MKNHFEHFQAFIEEQKKWFEQHLSADFAQTWNDHIWVQQLEAIQAQWHRRAKTQQLVAAESVLSGGVITEGKVRTLAQLFALEYQQLMQEND
ncbi:TPA: hypothetical protein HIF14_002277 [Escherichia coli]|nr:hypothetical protein [Escherichia coli]